MTEIINEHLKLPQGYIPRLNLYRTQRGIDVIKRTFQSSFSRLLNLQRVSAPLFVTEESGLNDNLNGYERPVSFDIPSVGKEAQIVHSLAKWKRLALARYDFADGSGLYTDMNAIRRDEALDNIHSVYVDQWDWEKIITKEQRNHAYLQETVRDIMSAVCETQNTIFEMYGQISAPLQREVVFVTSQELEDIYPSLTPKEREYEYVKIHRTVFIMNIGGKLRSGEIHDGRAPDYDDWNLNGDLILWNDTLEEPLEISSMGIRVSPESLKAQLKERGVSEWLKKPFHRMLASGQLPYTIGGGIGQSRLCMLLLGKAHIGEVQSSVWDQDTVEECKKRRIELL